MKLTKFDTEKVFQDREQQVLLLTEAWEAGDMDYFLRIVARILKSRDIRKTARETEMTHVALVNAFRDGGNPTLKTLSSVLAALDIKLSFSFEDHESEPVLPRSITIIHAPGDHLPAIPDPDDVQRP